MILNLVIIIFYYSEIMLYLGCSLSEAGSGLWIIISLTGMMGAMLSSVFGGVAAGRAFTGTVAGWIICLALFIGGLISLVIVIISFSLILFFRLIQCQSE